MTTLKQIELVCPNCENRFTSTATDAAEVRGLRRTDFQPYIDRAKTLQYGVHLCERCGFAGRAELFAEGEQVGYEVRRHVWDELAPRLSTSAPSAADKYEFAAKVAAWEGVSDREIADLWLRAAWCCVDDGDIEAERFYRRRAAWSFAACLEGYDDTSREERAVLTYLVGELWRRIGDQRRAREWFARVPGEITNDREQTWIVRLAQQQGGEPREWFV